MLCLFIFSLSLNIRRKNKKMICYLLTYLIFIVQKNKRIKMNIGIITTLLQKNFGDKYKFTIGHDFETIYIVNGRCKDKVFIYKDSINYDTLPFIVKKTLIFKKYYDMDAHSIESIFNPTQNEIIEFTKRCLED